MEAAPGRRRAARPRSRTAASGRPAAPGATCGRGPPAARARPAPAPSPRRSSTATRVGRHLGEDLLPAVGQHDRPQHAVAVDQPPQRVARGAPRSSPARRSRSRCGSRPRPARTRRCGRSSRPAARRSAGTADAASAGSGTSCGRAPAKSSTPSARRAATAAASSATVGACEQRAQRQVDAQPLADAEHQPGGQDRVAAQLEEVVPRAHPLHARAPRPRGRRDLLGGGRGGDVAGRRRGVAPGAGRAWRSTLPLGVRGRASRTTKADGTMYSGRRSPREGAARPRRPTVPAPGPAPGRRPGRRPRRVLAGHHHRLAHARVPAEHGLDLAQLDAEAADLHLEVDAAQELEIAVRAAAGEVAGPVEARAAGRAKGSGTKRSAVRSGRRR